MTRAVDPRLRFEAKYLVDPETGCWIWTGASNGNGWAIFSVGGKAIMAHRYAYETFVGHIDKGARIRRTCGVPVCVNPDHLLLVSNDPLERFWNNVDKGLDDHWLWKPKDYVYRIDGQSISPRRFAFQEAIGEPPGAFLYALCDEQNCINPKHVGDATDKFWAKVDKNWDGCWYWTGSKLPSGYPHLTYNNASVYAHRLSFEWAGGILEEGAVLTQSCEHRDCVNPDHLDQVSYQEMVDKREAKRIPEPCEVCGETFRSLKTHMRVHLDKT